MIRFLYAVEKQFGKFNLLLLTAAFVGLLFYLWYALSAWFFQDDFSLLKSYRDTIRLSDLVTFDSFGRFVSRNLYWHFMYAAFGTNAAMYFVVNLLLIIINSFLLYYFLKNLTQKRNLSLALSLIFFFMSPTVANYVWISNSQHILGQTFTLAFLILAGKYAREAKVRNLVFLVVSFLLGISSNFFIVMALPYLLFVLAASRRHKPIDILVCLLLAMISMIYGATLSTFAKGPYQTSYTIGTFLNTLRYYVHSGWPYVILAVVCGLSGLAVYKKDKPLFVLTMLSALFYLPFAFFVYQHYRNYIALSQIFFYAGLAYFFSVFLKREYLLVLLLIIGVAPHQLKRYATKPLGADVKRFVIAVKNLNLENVDTLYFVSKERFSNPTGVEVWNIPPFWWALAFGDALKLFVDDSKEYKLYEGRVESGRSAMIEVENLDSFRMVPANTAEVGTPSP